MTLSEFFEAWELFGDAVLAGTIAGMMLGFLGVYVVLRRMVFLTAAMSQTAGFGVVLSFWGSLVLAGAAHDHDEHLISPTLGAVVATFVAVGVLLTDRGQNAGRRDALLGALFLGASSGTVLLGTRIVQELHEVETLLFGTAVAVLPEQLHLLIGVASVLTVLHLVFYRGFVAVTVDRDGAAVRRMPAFLLDVVLLAGLAVAVSATTRVLGALPAFAFSVLPAMAAVRLAPNIPRALWIAGFLGGFCGFGGYLGATLWDLPVGAAQTALGVIVAVMGAGIGWVLSRFR